MKINDGPALIEENLSRKSKAKKWGGARTGAGRPRFPNGAADLAEKLGISYMAAYQRLRRGSKPLKTK